MRPPLSVSVLFLSWLSACAPPYAGDLRSQDPDRRRVALANNVGASDEASIQTALKFLKDEDALVRAQAIRCLGRSRRVDQTDAVLSRITGDGKDPAPSVRIAACQAAGDLGNPRAIAVLIGAMERDPDMDVRKAACRQLGRFRAKEIYEAWARGIDDADPGFSILCNQHLRYATWRLDAPRSRAEWEKWLAEHPDAWKTAKVGLR